MTKMRTARKDDLKIGAVLHDEYGAWGVRLHYSEGSWEIHGNSGCGVLDESEIGFYQVIDKTIENREIGVK